MHLSGVNGAAGRPTAYPNKWVTDLGGGGVDVYFWHTLNQPVLLSQPLQSSILHTSLLFVDLALRTTWIRRTLLHSFHLKDDDAVHIGTLALPSHD